MSTLIKKAILGSTTVKLGPSKHTSHIDDSIIEDNAEESHLRDTRQKELSLIKEQSFKEGYEKGLAKARAEAEQQKESYNRKQEEYHKEILNRNLEQQKSDFEEAFRAVEEYEKTINNNYEAQLILLTSECLYKLAGQKGIYESTMANVVKKELSRSVDRQYKTIRVPPSKELFFMDLVSSIKPKLRVTTDESLEPGACILESQFSKRDISFPVLLQQLSSCLAEALEEPDDEY